MLVNVYSSSVKVLYVVVYISNKSSVIATSYPEFSAFVVAVAYSVAEKFISFFNAGVYI